MSAIWWFVLVGVVVVLLATGAVLALRRRDGGSEHVLDAEPEDRPLAAVVVNPVKIDESVRGQVVAVCTGLGWAPPLWLLTSPEDPGTGQARLAVERGADVVIACGGDGTVRRSRRRWRSPASRWACCRWAPGTCWPARWASPPTSPRPPGWR